jgi:hypothetical protein
VVPYASAREEFEFCEVSRAFVIIDREILFGSILIRCQKSLPLFWPL